MTASAIGTTARAVALALVLALAAVTGIIVGNAIQGRHGNNAGYPEGWQGGAAAPISRTADSAFSLDAMSAVQAARGDAQTPDYVDYAQRHRQAKADDSADAAKKSLAKPELR